MALKQLMIRKKLEQKNKLMEELRTQETDLKKRSKDLESALEEAATDEEIAIVEGEINQLDDDQQELDGKKGALENEISQLETELEQLDNNAPDNNPTPPPAENNQRSNTPYQQGGEVRMRGNKYETRAQMLDRLKQDEVREFYSAVATAVKDKRASSLSGTDVLIPEAVLNMIQTRIGDYSNLYNEVNVVPLSGTARVLLDGAIPEAVWVEMCDPLEELKDAFSQTELDGWKVGAYMVICNAVLEDSMIDLANFVESRIAQSIAKAIDRAILTGKGAEGKQPLGVITSLQKNEPTRIVTSDGTLSDVMLNMGLIDDGEDGPTINEVIAVMRRSTFYSRVAPQTFMPTADGRLVVQTAPAARMPDGTRIVFSQYEPIDEITMGDFNKYMLGERRGVQLAVSTDVQFIQDNTVFKGTARYDGKPVYDDYFVQIKLNPLEQSTTSIPTV